MSIRSTVKSVDHQVKECVKKISENDLRWLYVRLKERVGADISEALVFIQDNYGELHRAFSGAPNAESVFNMIDMLDKQIQEEVKRRNIRI